MRPDADYWIEKLALTSHVEGGAFRQYYQSSLSIPRAVLPAGFAGDRPVSTAIYFLLQQGQFSAMHRIASDEVWHFYYGDPLLVYEIRPDGELISHLLGNDPMRGQSFQCVVKAGSWFGSIPANNSEYALVACTVAPGFDFADFALADRNTLQDEFPQHAALIEMLTR